MKVLKFGWTSVWSTEMINNTAKIIFEAKKDENIVVVVSAMTWVTNSLIEICNLVEKWNLINVLDLFNKLKNKHLIVAKELINDNLRDNNYLLVLEQELDNLEDIFKWVTLLKSLTDKIKAQILYFGEILSSILVSISINNLWIKSNNYLSKNFLICDWSYLNWDCNFSKSEKFMENWLKNIDLKQEIPVITWFWWWDENWSIYLFDRWWSDYVASLIWRFLKADCIEVWTDVDWIMSADPRIVKNPVLWEELDYSVCAEFALVWAKVLHPKTISPAKWKNIPVFVKNTFNPKAKWTKICNVESKWLKWINIDNEQVILNFIDPTMILEHWYVYDVLKLLNNEKISIDTLATTETSFSISIKSKYFSDNLCEKFSKLKENFKIDIYKNISKISFVWDNIDNYKVLSYFDEIIMISSWAYWKSLTVFVKCDDSKALLCNLHEKVFSLK